MTRTKQIIRREFNDSKVASVKSLKRNEKDKEARKTTEQPTTSAHPKKVRHAASANNTGDDDAAASVVRRRRRYKPGTVALREVRRYQRGTDLLIRRLPYQRFVRSVADTHASGTNNAEGLRFQGAAIDLLQEASENYLISCLIDAKKLSAHANRIGVNKRDIAMVLEVRNAAWDELFAAKHAKSSATAAAAPSSGKK